MIDKKTGLYIVIEGPAHVGKTTQIEMLASRLRAEGYGVRQFSEPGNQTDLTAHAIRMLVKDPHYLMKTNTEVLLFNAAQAQSLEVIRNSRDKGVVCLSDGGFLTTLANQYYGQDNILSYESLDAITDFAVGDMQPDLTIILDAPTNILQKRYLKQLPKIH